MHNSSINMILRVLYYGVITIPAEMVRKVHKIAQTVVTALQCYNADRIGGEGGGGLYY